MRGWSRTARRILPDGAALALAARLEGRKAHVVMPENASPIKLDAVRRYGGQIHFCAPTQQAREEGLARLVEDGCIPIPPYDHADIIAGQGLPGTAVPGAGRA